MQKVQRFGGAMFTPVLFFAVFGIIVGFATLFKNNLVFGSLADPGSRWYQVWDVIYNGANTVFKQMPLLFAIGLPVSLAKKQQARACLEAFVIYVIFLYLTSTILQYWGPVFGVDFESTARTSGLATVASVLGNNSVSIEQVVQKEKSGDDAEIVVITNHVRERHLRDALLTFQNMSVVRSIPSLIRVYG